MMKDDIFDDEICGKCKFHRTADDGTWICNNEDSECFGCATEYRDCCMDFEDRHERITKKYEW